MQEFEEKLRTLERAVLSASEKIGLEDMKNKLQKLEALMQKPDFWSDSIGAQEISKNHAKLESRVSPWLELQKSLAEIQELLEVGDTSILPDLEEQYESTAREFEKLKRELKFSGPYDDHDVILSIYSGAGGTDAQDWAAMLLRMYVRYAEQNKFSVTTIDQSPGDEAGLKSATLEISGKFIYGRLKGEHGVHRLVRLSPFNADNLRQTSFAKVDILPKIEQNEELQVDERDLKIDVYRAGGHGGQSVNTTDSAVRITHIPTGISVAIQNERSQLQNKETAMTILRSRLAQLQLEQHANKLAELKGPNQSAEWGNQIRSYVLHPYKQVKDLRTRYESSDPEAVLDGDLNGFIESYLEHSIGES